MVQTIRQWLAKVKETILNILKNKSIGEYPDSSITSQIPLQEKLTKQQLLFIKRYEGKLLLRQEIPLNDKDFYNLIEQRYFTQVDSFYSTPFSNRCLRCNNKDRKFIGKFPCSKCKVEHFYCRNCIMMGRVSACEKLYKWSGPSYPWKKINQACTWQGKLTYAQNEASKAVEEAVLEEREQLIWAVTGAGKTEILFKGINRALSQGKRVCISTPRSDVVRELLPRIQEAFANIPVQALYGNSRDREGTAQLMITTTHQLIRFREAFDLLIIDEIDAFPYHHDKSLQFATNRAVKKVSSKIYLTATPRKNLKRKVRLKQLPYCFVPIRYHGYPLPVPQSVSDYKSTNEVQNSNLPKSFISWLTTRENNQRQLLIFVPTIDISNRLLNPVRKLLLEKGFITSKSFVTNVHSEDRLREQKIKKFRKKHLHVLITTTILERGVTFPSIDVIVLHAGHKVFDEAALIQIAGRAGRNKDDPEGEVLFIHDGKTEAIEGSILSIKQMNRRGKKLYIGEGK